MFCYGTSQTDAIDALIQTELETNDVDFLAFFVSLNAERRDSIPDSNAVSDVTQICLR